MLLMTSLLCPKNVRQWSINDLRLYILENHGAMHLQWSIIVQQATFLGNYAFDKMVTMSQFVRQWSVNDICAGILDNITGMERKLITMNLLAACIVKNKSVNIASASYNWAPTVCPGSKCYAAIHCSMLFLNGGLCGQSLQSVLVFNITTMHAMLDWSDYFACSCRVDI
jgi:hypothetical protein